VSLTDVLIPIATFGGGIIGTWLLKPKALAEARKANAEADKLDWDRFHGEILRLELKISAQDAKISQLETDRDERAVVSDKREIENRSLRATVKRLEGRIAELEAIFKLHPLPPEMQAALDKLK
jgi:hypothetical protein